tara:strand:+ start:95778 stop:95885 length:108 start_codon:yes stop_codon:yes gene_type:complete
MKVFLSVAISTCIKSVLKKVSDELYFYVSFCKLAN